MKSLREMVEDQGSRAKENGAAPWDNPFLTGTEYHAAWERGWDRANEMATA